MRQEILQTMAQAVARQPKFKLEEAFKRNLGFISTEEMDRLSKCCVAIAGLGGMGGAHVELLARQGIGSFKLADFDRFEMANMNRQFGATTRTVGSPKIEVLNDRLKAINPSARVELFPDGINRENIGQFLEGVDVVIDGVDFFAIDVRRLLFTEAYKRNIHAVTAGPLGFGAALQVVVPGHMTLDEFYGFTDEMSNNEKLIRFAAGISPQAFHCAYMDMNYVDIVKRQAPSSSIGVALAAAMAELEVLKILLKWENVKGLPHYKLCDIRRQRWFEGKLSNGNRSLMQRFKLWLLRQKLETLGALHTAAPAPDISYRFFKDSR